MATPPDDGFDALDIPEPLREAIRARGLTTPSLVQSSVAAPDNAGRDLLVSAKTGSGKTLAFGFLIAQEILPAGERTKAPLALVLAPTRELAVQVQKELEWLFAKSRTRVLSATGGTNAREEMVKLKAGCDILVATPGRLVDHLKRKSVSLGSLKAVVLDEGDEMLRFGFREDLETILKGAPANRRTHLFSATLPAAILKLASTYQQDPVRISASAAGAPVQHEDIEYIAHVFGPGEREGAVVNVLRRHDAASAIVFTETRAGAAKLGADLARRGFAAVTLSGEMTQPERTRALASLRDGRAKVLVATDVAARGLDLPDVGLVIHADLPNDASGITHRSGRTGRAGRKGVSVLLASRNERNSAERMLRGAGVRVRWSPLPTREEIAAADAERLVTELAEQATTVTEASLAEVDRLIQKIPVRDLVAVLLSRVVSAQPAAVPLRAAVDDGAQRGREREHERAPRGYERSERDRPARFEREARDRASGASEDRERDGRRNADRARTDREPRPAPRARDTGMTGADRRSQPMVLFRVNVGEANKAEPRWLVPLICRRGGIEGPDIGKIRIGPRSTLFEVEASQAASFEKKSAQPDPKDPRVQFERATADAATASRPERTSTGERPAREDRRPATAEAPRDRERSFPPRADRDRDRDRATPAPERSPSRTIVVPASRDRGLPTPATRDREAPAAARPPRREIVKSKPRADEPAEDLGTWKAPRGKPRAQTPAGYDD